MAYREKVVDGIMSSLSERYKDLEDPIIAATEIASLHCWPSSPELGLIWFIDWDLYCVKISFFKSNVIHIIFAKQLI